jgi:hypothetical protein
MLIYFTIEIKDFIKNKQFLRKPIIIFAMLLADAIFAVLIFCSTI